MWLEKGRAVSTVQSFDTLPTVQVCQQPVHRDDREVYKGLPSVALECSHALEVLSVLPADLGQSTKVEKREMTVANRTFYRHSSPDVSAHLPASSMLKTPSCLLGGIVTTYMTSLVICV